MLFWLADMPPTPVKTRRRGTVEVEREGFFQNSSYRTFPWEEAVENLRAVEVQPEDTLGATDQLLLPVTKPQGRQESDCP